ncbi:MAG: matrixin family metalloprotease [bacterium]|nr:matrixin family metalloprotease [bacterium]
MMRILASVLGLVTMLAACTSDGGNSRRNEEPRVISEFPALPASTETRVLEPVGPESTYLQPNTKDVDETAAYVHYTREHMPLRINVDMPRVSARYANREQTREAVLNGMRAWGVALQRDLPWFALQFVENDPEAPVQITWRRRLAGDYAGWGGIGWEVRDGVLKLGSTLEYTTQTCLEISCQLTANELRLLIAHEFGHVLGLRHCLDCDSAMNYAWHTRDRVVVTEHDIRTYRALNEQPNGTRVDGQLLESLR